LLWSVNPLHIRLSQKCFHEAISTVSKTLPQKAIIAILSTIKIVATSSTLTFTASNGEQTILYTIDTTSDEMTGLEIIEPGQVCVPSKFFVDIAHKLPKDQIDLRIDQMFQMHVRCGTMTMKLAIHDAEEYPYISSLLGYTNIPISCGLLKKLIRYTTFAVSDENTNEITSGVYWLWENNTLQLYATNKQRLIAIKRNISTHTEKPISFTISSTHLNELFKILPDDDQTIEITLSDHQILFKFDKILFYARLLNGKYPDVKSILSFQPDTKIQLDALHFFDAIQRSYLLVRNDEIKISRINTMENENYFLLTSHANQIGQVSEEIFVHACEGPSQDISFNTKYILDVLKNIEYNTIILGLSNESNKPIMVTSKTDPHLIYLMLPYRTAYQ
jgi:DNA polymerase-3 subunit beta